MKHSLPSRLTIKLNKVLSVTKPDEDTAPSTIVSYPKETYCSKKDTKYTHLKGFKNTSIKEEVEKAFS